MDLPEVFGAKSGTFGTEANRFLRKVFRSI